MASLKGPGAPQKHDGSSLRIGIVHARWNTAIIDSLVFGAQKALLASGVKRENIVIESVPGSYELPLAVQRFYAASQIQSTTSAVAGGMGSLASGIGDLLGGGTSTTDLHGSLQPTAPEEENKAEDKSLKHAFDAIIAIGVLIKGETMHFEYIADAVTHGLMRVQLDTGAPVIFGLLTVLSEEQGLARAGLEEGQERKQRAITMGRTGDTLQWSLDRKEKIGVKGRYEKVTCSHKPNSISKVHSGGNIERGRPGRKVWTSDAIIRETPNARACMH